MNVLPAYGRMHQECAWCPQKSNEGVRSEPDPLWEQLLFLVTGPSLQPMKNVRKFQKASHKIPLHWSFPLFSSTSFVYLEKVRSVVLLWALSSLASYCCDKHHDPNKVQRVYLPYNWYSIIKFQAGSLRQELKQRPLKNDTGLLSLFSYTPQDHLPKMARL